MMRLLGIVASLTALFWIGGMAHGQCYSSYSSPVYSSYSSPVYSYPVTVKEYVPIKEVVVKKEYVPVAVPVSYPTVAVPVYSYINAAPSYCSPGYASPGYGYPAVSAYPASPYPAAPGYPGYSGGMSGPPATAAPAAPSADQIADIVISRLEQRLSLPPAVPTPGPGAYAPPKGAGPPAAAGPAPASGNTTLQGAVALLTNKCASCHSGDGSRGGGFAMFNDSRQLLALSRERRWDVYDQVYQGTMPKGGTQLNDQETELVRQWARQK